MWLPWVICGALFLTILGFITDKLLTRAALREIETTLDKILSEDTNVLLSVSSGSRSVRRLAAGLNRHLRVLRERRRRYQNGDRELTEAVVNISHDLRTPLTAMGGYLDLLAQEEMPGRVRDYLAQIESRANALRVLTEELFAYSHSFGEEGPEPPEYEEICLNAALEQNAAAFYAAFKERGITPEIKMPETKVYRRLNPSALTRILENVLYNALKYSDGDLSIALDEAGEIIFSNAASGLDEMRAGKLFNRFYTVNAARRSTGLGLSIAKTLAERMGGEMSAAYRDGRLSVRLFFP
jgi:signal transduction histidine kinase